MSKWHLINEEGNQIEVDSSEMNDEKYAGYRFDHGWYKAHGYVDLLCCAQHNNSYVAQPIMLASNPNSLCA